MEALRERFGKYHVLEKIAQGGMAEVYKVKTVGIAGFEKVQALKRILPHSARQDRFIRSFIDEARIAVELTHRNIVQVFDFGKADGELYMAMELIEGRDLRTAMAQAVARDALCPIAVAAYVIGEVAAGLDYAHRKTDGYGGPLGIVHCDVSPSNVMLSADGYVKILDFGIARATFASALERRRLRGKPRYMAPEQTIGEPPTAQADVFALGIIAWELFTGLPLFRGHDVKAILEAVRRTDPPRIDRLNPDVPEEIASAVAVALSREPSTRGTAADLAAACTRTAMAASARQLAAWLGALDDGTHDRGTLDRRALESGALDRGAAVPASEPRGAVREPTESVVEAPPRSSTHVIPTPVPGSATHVIPTPVPGSATHVIPTPVPGSATYQIPTPLPGSATYQIPTPLPGSATYQIPTPLPGSTTYPIAPPPPGSATHPIASEPPPPMRSATHPIASEPPPMRSATHPIAPPPPGSATYQIPTPLPGSTTYPIAPPPPGSATHPIASEPPPMRSATQPIASEPPLRPSTRSISTSMASVAVPPDFGEGTPGPSAPRFLDRNMTISVIEPHPRFLTADTRTTAVSQQAWTASEKTTAVSQQAWTASEKTTAASQQAWTASEKTTEGVGKLQDVLDTYGVPAHAEPRVTDPVPTEAVPAVPARRYEAFVPATTNPAAIRFDDDETQFGFAAPPIGEATSFDDLEVEQDDIAPAESVVGDEPIDDDLGALATAVPAERRRTVVVAAQLDGADAGVLRPIARSLGELAYLRGGVVIEHDDDALIVAFGLEVAGEDDVAIAMGWALDATSLTRDASGTEHGSTTAPALRIGARTGVATASGRTSSSAPERNDGGARIPVDAIEEARMLAREASPDRPLFVGAAGRITSGLYTLREVPAPKRIGRRGRVIELVGPRGFDERDRARLERRGKFIGRTQPLAELDAWFQRAIAADRRLTALISGAAGTGKSRLVAELIARQAASDTPMRVVMTAANPASHHAPFALVIELYQAALGLPPARGRHARAQLVQRVIHLMKEAHVADDRARDVAADLARAMELRDGVGVAAPEVADLRPRISAGLAAFRVAMIDRSRPLLTVIEDIHLSDAASLEVLRHTLAVTAMGPELLLLTARPEGAPPPSVDVVLPINDLVGGELRALIADRLGDAATPLNIAAVIARGGGNPLFVEELAQAVREDGDDVPATARDVVAARVDRLTPKAKTALRFAAVLGGTVRARLLEELMAEESLGAELDELVDAGFLVRPDGAAHSSEGELQFARGLVREVIYDSLPLRAQRENHARVGRLLASRFFAGREEPPAMIAEHMERGGELAAAAAFWLRAGRLALAASDADTAVAHYSRTLQLERELGATPPTTTSRARRREALAGREEAHRARGDVVTDAGDLDELERLCEGDARRLADVAIRRAHRLLRLGDYASAHSATVIAEDHALAADARRLRGEALCVRGEVLERLGRFDEALVIVGDAGELFAREGAVADEMAAMVGRGRIHLMRAHYEAARDAYRPVIARIEKTGDPGLERIVQNHVAVIEMCLGNFTLAMQSAQRSLELCRRYGDRTREGDGLSVAGIILLQVGLYDQAAGYFTDALDLLARTASRWSHADCLIYAGVCDTRRGGPGGIAMLDEALAESRRLGARYLEVNALISRAGAHLWRGDLGAAIADADEGTHVAAATMLVGYEIQGLARHAVALVRDPSGAHLATAVALVDRALALLDHQRYLEGSEEEVYASCAEVLHAAGAGERAAAVLARGRASIERKLASLADPVWRTAFASIAEHRYLLG